MMNVRRLLVLALVTSLGGCAQIIVSSDHDPSASFSGLRTYAWRSDPPTLPDDPRLSGPFFAAQVHKAVDKGLAAKGYEEVTSGEPHFLVGYHVVLQEKLETATMNTSYGYRRGWGWGGMSQTHLSSFEQGTLILDIVDPETKRLVWRGSAKAVVDFSASKEKRERRLNRAVKKLLKSFPPK